MDENISGSWEDMILKCLSEYDDCDMSISNKEACKIYLLETFIVLKVMLGHELHAFEGHVLYVLGA